jgi:carboxyl-terminal processing protease
MKRLKWLLFGITLGVVCFFTIKVAHSAFQPPERSLYEELPLFSEVLTYVKQRYVEEIKAKDMIYGALQGLCSALDPHSEFLPPTQFEELKVETQGEFGGIGIVISIRNNVLVVVSPLVDSPAEKAGLKPQDRIVEIEGASTKGITLNEAVKKMRGRPKSKVKITVLRENEEKLLKFEVERKIIQIKSVKFAHLFEKNIGYIRIVEFTDKTYQDLQKAMLSLREEGAKAWIWDLRNNPGGLLDSAVNVAKLILAKNSLIVYTKGRTPEDEMSFYSNSSNAPFPEPLVVLVNEGSASASEIIAGAVKDNSRGKVVGKKTFGKGSVQTVFPLQDGSALRLTTSLYYTAKGHVINMNGIMPDVVIDVQRKPEKKEDGNKEETEESSEDSDRKGLDPSRDQQLKKAIETVRELLNTPPKA